MNREEIFDTQGQDGQDNQEAFNKLPVVVQYFISSQQKLINTRVENAVRRKFGESGLSSLIKTSGFRSYVTNQRHNGKPDSLHLFGCAVDFAKYGIFKDMKVPTCEKMEIIDSGDCWHIQIKRGK